MIKKLVFLVTIIVCISILVLSLRGIQGNPTHETLNFDEWKDMGPLELSPDRGRFALLYSIVEDNSFHFSLPVARFATPDLGYANGKYVSLFAPGLSFLLIPGYMIGKYFGMAQIGSFAIISLFAFLNFILIREIAIRLNSHPIAATIAAFAFLFATPAFSYAVSLYQHHPSTFLLLLSIYVLLRWNNIFSLGVVWFSCVAAISLDYPNFFMFFPIGIFALSRFIQTESTQAKLIFKIKWPYIFSFITIVPPLLFFLWFNKVSYGDPLQLAGTIGSVKAIDEKGLPAAPENERAENIQYFENPELQEKSAVNFFNTRFLVNGFYTHFLSADRGIVVYTPIILLALLGLKDWYINRRRWLVLLIAIVGANILLYSMWVDPYGGWAFGSRYLIASYALLSILISTCITKYRKNILFMTALVCLFIYSSSVNTIGAVTSNRNPPKVEVLGLEELTGREEKYTFERNIQMLDANISKSYVFQTNASKVLTAWEYTSIIIGIINVFFICLVITMYIQKEKKVK